MTEGAQADAKTEKSSGGRDKAVRPAAPVQGAFAGAAPTLIPPQGAGLANLLAASGPARRAEIVLGLQRSHGNAFVERAISSAIAARASGPEGHGAAQPLAEDSTEAPLFPDKAGHGALNAGQVQWGKHAQFPDVMGQTYYARKDIEIWPAYRTKTERTPRLGIPPWGFQTKPMETDAAGGVFNALATPENSEGYKMPVERPQYPGYEVYIRESGAAANNIAAAEQQHINDLDTGWAITGVAAKDAINQVAGEDPEVKDDAAAAKKAAVDKTAAKMGALGAKIRGALESEGRLEDALGPMMDNSFVQSGQQRDATGKHNIPIRYVMKDDQKKRILYEVNDDFKLDTTPSTTVVNLGTVG